MKNARWLWLMVLGMSCSQSIPDASEPEWQSCAGKPGVGCATLHVPLDWNDPGGAKITYALQRVPAPAQPSSSVLLYIAGGPGASGDSGVTMAPTLQAILPGMDVIAPDHRGAGHSTWLGCDPLQPSQDLNPPCIEQVTTEYGTNVGSYFSATQAARDIQTLASALRRNGKRVYLYGESYGTFLVNRYLSIYPSGVDGAILDSVVRPDGYGPFLNDGNETPANRIGHQVFDACAADSFCSGKLGSDPWSLLGDLHGKLATGYCAGAIPAGTSDASGWLKNQLYLMGSVAPGAAQSALVYRLHRCSSSDVSALVHFGARGALPISGAQDIVTGTTGGCRVGQQGLTGNCGDGGVGIRDGATLTPVSAAYGENELVHYNIELSDMLNQHPPIEALVQSIAASYVDNSQESGGLLQATGMWPWPLYDPGVPQAWASTEAPLLLLDGMLDAETPSYALDDASAHFSRSNQHVVIIPNAVHVTLEHSAQTASSGTLTCGMQIATEFLRDPQGVLDTRCAQEIPPLDFQGDSSDAQTLFGTSDFYE